MSYLLIQGTKIIEYSFEIPFELNYTELFFPQEAFQIIPTNCFTYAHQQSLQNSGTPIIMPLLAASGYMKFKLSSTTVFPKIEQGLEYFWSFRSYVSEYSIIFYVTEHAKIIKNLNEEAIKDFKLCEALVKESIIENSSTCLTELIILTDGREKISLNQSERVKCCCNLSKFKEEGHKNRCIVDGELVLIQVYSNEHKLFGFKKNKYVMQDDQKRIRREMSEVELQ